MEKTSNLPVHETASPEATRSHPERPKISLLAIISRLLVALIVLGAAGYYAMSMIAARPEPVQRQPRERSFTVEVIPAAAQTFQPAIGAYGEVVAGRSIEIRSQVSGEAVEISPNLAAGGRVSAGELLVAIDSFDYDGAVREAEGNLADARLELASAQEQLALQRINLQTAQAELDVAQRDLERAQSLSDSGTITSKTIEDRQLLVTQRTQAVAQSENAVRTQQVAIERQRAAIESAEWSLEQARRALRNTRMAAPFDGIVVSETAQQGRVISNNEVVAQIYDIDALEVRFTLSDAEYGQLANAGLLGREVTATWDVEPDPIEVTGQIVRVGAQVDATLGGVTVFARLTGDQVTSLRPGTFVEVTVAGIEYENAYKVPETAIYDNGTLYIRNAERRMQSVPVRIAARDGEDVIVRGDVPEGAQIITTHLAQAGDGVLVQLEGEDSGGGRRGGPGGPGGGG